MVRRCRLILGLMWIVGQCMIGGKAQGVSLPVFHYEPLAVHQEAAVSEMFFDSFYNRLRFYTRNFPAPIRTIIQGALVLVVVSGGVILVYIAFLVWFILYSFLRRNR